ncbi:hypothetical protein BpHYR1_011064 [Brachionus plicatilis]|uniref:Secreted protein n=1 Tax=Brachionus plicatilis TaxID=10195 RepID=A0A3M7PMT9_BRAPC|nr:hypothetical protein BpHYR1_011064 [Brachionus plicatilis]
MLAMPPKRIIRFVWLLLLVRHLTVTMRPVLNRGDEFSKDGLLDSMCELSLDNEAISLKFRMFLPRSQGL